VQATQHKEARGTVWSWMAGVGCCLTVLAALGLGIPVTGAQTPAPGGPIAIGMLASLWGPTEDMLGVRDGLAALGYRQDEQVAFGFRAAEGHEDTLDTIARQLVRDGAQLLIASDWKALQAAQRVTTRTPIVFTAWYDPVKHGVINRLGENVTGVIPAFPEVSPKALEVFRALLPTLQRLLLPYDADDPDLVEALRAVRVSAARLGITLVERAIRTQEEARQAMMTAHEAEVDGILPVGGRWNIAGYALQASLQQRLPALFARAWMADYGGLASYGPSWHGLGVQAAQLVVRLLQGANPAELPVQTTQQMELVINARTAQALGITVPPSLLARADRVIR
jgi:putative ABC transport system substrate-binding protein